MKNLLLILFAFIPVISISQSKDSKSKFKEYTESELFKADGRNIVVSMVVEDIPGTKDEIYIRAKNFFARNYNDSKSVIQTDDKESGTIIGKGFYNDIHSHSHLLVSVLKYNAYHILRVDIKDGRVRIINSVNDMEQVIYTDGKDSFLNYGIVDYYPFTDERFRHKGGQMDAFLKLVDSMNITVERLESALREGVISGENEEW